jgi:hypothetical protein
VTGVGRVAVLRSRWYVWIRCYIRSNGMYGYADISGPLLATLAFTASNSARAAKEVFPLRIYNCDCFSSSSASLFQDDAPETDESSRGPFSSPSTAYTLRYRRVPRALRYRRVPRAARKARLERLERLGCALIGCSLTAYGEWRL